MSPPFSKLMRVNKGEDKEEVEQEEPLRHSLPAQFSEGMVKAYFRSDTSLPNTLVGVYFLAFFKTI